MGQIIIEIPQDGNHAYRLVSEDSVKRLLLELEELANREKEDEDILGLWTAPEPAARNAAA
jgi:hypothetical protein